MRELELITIGGGASGTAVLQALAARQEDLSGLRLTVLERTQELGPGLPYGEAADTFHTMGRTRTLRHEKGQQLRERFARSVDKLRRSGARVDVHTSQSVRELTALSGGWKVTTDKLELQAPHVVLATGHWHVHRLAHLSRAVDWRWDVRRLHAGISDHEDVLVLGMGQSGLDAAVSLAEKRRDVRGAGRVVLASRYGLLPSVFGHVGPKLGNSFTPALEALRSVDALRLEQLLDAVRADTQARSDSPLPAWNESAAHELIEQSDRLALLRAETKLAQVSHEQLRPIPWHPVLWHGMELFHELMPRLPAEDRLTLAAHWTPLMRYAEAIHVDAARRLLGHLERGAISVTALGENPTLGEEGQSVWARGSRAEVRAHRVVDARGPDPRIERSDDSLLTSLLAAEVLSPARIPFLSSPAQRIPEGWRVEPHEGGHVLITGGLWVNPRSFEAWDRSGTPRGLFALGPLTMGQFPFYAGLWASRRAATLVVQSLLG